MPVVIAWGLLVILGVALIVWGVEVFAKHLGSAEELATGVTASLRGVPVIAFGDVIGANIAICLVALGAGAWVTPLPFSRRVMRYALSDLPIGVLAFSSPISIQRLSRASMQPSAKKYHRGYSTSFLLLITHLKLFLTKAAILSAFGKKSSCH